MATRKTTKKTTRKTARTKTATPLSTRQRRTRKTAPSPQKSAPPTTDPQLTAKSWRVFRISDALRQAMKDRRDAAITQSSLRDVVTLSVRKELPGLVQSITNLLLDAERSQPDNPVRPIRMQIDDSTLEMLRYAALQTGLPAQRLMLACCRLASAKLN